jgi:hypothetical protein
VEPAASFYRRVMEAALSLKVTTALPNYDITSQMNIVLSSMCHRRNAGNSFVTVDRW